jgi:integrase
MNGKIAGFTYSSKTGVAHFSVYVPKSNGKLRRERTVRAASRDEALDLWRAFRDEVRGVTAPPPAAPHVIATSAAVVAAPPEPPVLTFREFIATHLDAICARKAKKTLEIYRTIATTRLVRHFGEKRLDEIYTFEVEDFMAVMLAESTPAYVNNCVRTLRALLNHAVKRHLIAASPLTDKLTFEDVELPELELSDAERVAFLGAFDDETGFRTDVATRRREAHVVTSAHFNAPRAFGFGPDPQGDVVGEWFARFRSLKPIFVVALETGLRKSDLLSLQWSQVNLGEGAIRVRMKKTKKWAVAPISQLCRAALDACRGRPVVSRYVFVTDEGTRVPEISVRRAFLRAKRIAGITRRFRFHDLRHSAACALASAGVSLQVIQKILGHTSIKMTERYVRVDDAAVARARAALDARNAQLGLISGTPETGVRGVK